jgi:hypothetical protein
MHLSYNIRRWASERNFTTLPGMVIHLEAGKCISSIDEPTLNTTAAHLYQWKHLIGDSTREGLQAGEAAASLKVSHKEHINPSGLETEWPF